MRGGPYCLMKVYPYFTNRPHLFISSGVILNADTGGVETLAAGTFPTGLDVKSDRFCNQGTDVSNFDSEFECFDQLFVI